MLYPDKIDAFHTTRWQKHALIYSIFSKQNRIIIRIEGADFMYKEISKLILYNDLGDNCILCNLADIIED
ncbi:hypothetical protein KPL47_23825, partial [Clostridium estertheticum]|uniref:hypothetical protein n=1 Tax=Clostridium estertheticum TaxID=238834 RepID=UPI001C0CAECF